MIQTNAEYKKALSLLDKETEHRESFLGMHFINTYQKCPWKFFLKYVLGFMKDTNPRYFIRGQAIHSAIEHFLNGVDIKTVRQMPIAYIHMHKDKYHDDEERNTDVSLVQEGINEWLKENSDDLEIYEEIEHETPHVIYLSNGFPITVRLDRLVRSKETGRLYIIDTKTTKNNMSSILKQLRYGYQGIGYMYAVWKIYNEKPAGVIGDILLMKANKYSNRIESFRSPVITYSDYAYIQWEMNIIGLLSEISQKVKAFYNNELPEEVLFSRNPSDCQFMGCEYESICQRHNTFDVIPEGFYRDPWVDEDKVKELITDRNILDNMLYDLTVKYADADADAEKEAL